MIMMPSMYIYPRYPTKEWRNVRESQGQATCQGFMLSDMISIGTFSFMVPILPATNMDGF